MERDPGLWCKIKRLGQRRVVDIAANNVMLLRVGGSDGCADTLGYEQDILVLAPVDIFQTGFCLGISVCKSLRDPLLRLV